MHQLSRVLETCQVAQFRHGRHGHRALDLAQGLKGFDHWSEAPGFDLLVECEFQTPETVTLCSDGLDVCLKDDLLRRCGTDHRAEPAQVSGTPGGSTGRAAIVPEHEGFEPQLGRLQIAQGLFTRPAQVAEGFIVNGGHLHGGEAP